MTFDISGVTVSLGAGLLAAIAVGMAMLYVDLAVYAWRFIRGTL